MARELDHCRKPSLLPLWITVSAFGPYVMAQFGLRLEHFVIYPLLPAALLLLSARRRSLIAYAPISLCLLLLLTTTLWTLTSTFLGGQYLKSVGKVAAGLENYTQPMAILVILSAFVRLENEEAALSLFRKTCRVFVLMLVLNSFVGVSSLFLDLQHVLGYFTGDPSLEGTSVAQRAASMGRFSGIFNQPSECGLTYSLGLLAWAYLVRARQRAVFSDYATLGCLLLGGALSISKIFILGGCPLLVLYSLSSGWLRRFMNWQSLFGGTIAALVLSQIFQRWSGLDFFLRLFRATNDPSRNIISFYTAGRFGDEQTLVKSLFSRVWTDAPFSGFGYGADTPFDNAYLEFFYQGGMVALVGYCLLLLVIASLGLKQYRSRSEEGRFLLMLSLFVVLGGMGAPVVTINRFSTVFWVFLVLLCAIFAARQRSRAAAAARAPAVGLVGAGRTPARWAS